MTPALRFSVIHERNVTLSMEMIFFINKRSHAVVLAHAPYKTGCAAPEKTVLFPACGYLLCGWPPALPPGRRPLWAGGLDHRERASETHMPGLPCWIISYYQRLWNWNTIFNRVNWKKDPHAHLFVLRIKRYPKEKAGSAKFSKSYSVMNIAILLSIRNKIIIDSR